MLPGEDEVEAVEADELADDGVSDDELLDFDDEVPAGEGAFSAEGSDDYASRQGQKVALTDGATADAKGLLAAVRRSKKKAKR